ncbi:MAG: hypothetical protein HYT80_08340 [Euryarchaeota archaeon]|nr:hypothetical protein [Euryarchaeota archaeon]
MRRFAILLAALLFLMVPPNVAAQTPVSKCSQECDPIAINGGAVKRGDDPVKVVLYAHFEDHLQLAPLNTQPPHPEKEVDLNAGFPFPVLETNTGAGCQVQGNCLDPHFRNNEFRLFSSPGLVEYLSDGWRIHPEPGLAADVKIVEKEFNLYFYLSAYAIPGQNSHSSYPDVGVMPQVGVYARMETGRHTFSRLSTVIAEAADPVGPLASERRYNMVTQPNEPDVYEFKVPMKVLKDTLPSEAEADGFIVYVSPYQVRTEPHPNQAHQFMQEEWRLRTGHKFPTRLVLPVEHAMMNVASSLSIFQDLLFVRWSFLSPWGSYDMRDNEIKLESTGPNPIDAKAMELVRIKRSIDHDGHFKPVNATWSIDFLGFPLKDGEYELTASIPNLQGTYVLEQKFPFRVVNGAPDVTLIGQRSAGGKAQANDGAGFKDTPAPGPVALGIVLSAAVALARRRPG